MFEEIFKYKTLDGRDVICYKLFEFNLEGKDYIGYVKRNENGSLKAYANRYYPDDLSKGVEPIKSERAAQKAKERLRVIQDEIEEHMKRKKGGDEECG